MQTLNLLSSLMAETLPLFWSTNRHLASFTTDHESGFIILVSSLALSRRLEFLFPNFPMCFFVKKPISALYRSNHPKVNLVLFV